MVRLTLGQPDLFKEARSGLEEWSYPIIHASLISGTVPQILKEAVIRPLSKKSTLDVKSWVIFVQSPVVGSSASLRT